MPSTSKAQHNFMEAVAHNPDFAKKAGVPQSVGKDFAKADKENTFGDPPRPADPKAAKPAKKKESLFSLKNIAMLARIKAAKQAEQKK